LWFAFFIVVFPSSRCSNTQLCFTFFIIISLSLYLFWVHTCCLVLGTPFLSTFACLQALGPWTLTSTFFFEDLFGLFFFRLCIFCCYYYYYFKTLLLFFKKIVLLLFNSIFSMFICFVYLWFLIIVFFMFFCVKFVLQKN
jgi:hypothetical protein